MLAELNLGAEAAVFIDDSPFERDNVKSFLPEITVTENLDMGLFDVSKLTQEDLHRLQMYKVEKERQKIKEEAGSFDEWLKTLKISLRVDKLNESNLPRATQLLNKTNQMNLRTRRMSEKEFYSWSQQENNHVRVFWVADKFGDSGLTAVVSLVINGNQAEIVDFVMSCRIMGRQIERNLVSFITRLAGSLGAKEITAQYSATIKNKPCLDFWLNSNFNVDQSKKVFTWPLSKEYKAVSHITLEDQNA
jgi:FkbH-like protein